MANHNKGLPEENNPSKIYYLKKACPGISRKKVGQSFTYCEANGERVMEPDELARIKSLVLPPAWRNVWISPYPNSHLQATGIDARGRKQYRYHPEWNKKRSETKFSMLTTFARTLPKLRREIESHLRDRGIHKQKVIALVIDLMSKSYIRIGNANYAKENGSYGLTTLRNKHIDIHGDTIRFAFIGKEGVPQDIELHDRKLARILKSCKDIPGQELFQYFDAEGNKCCIDSGDINSYLHEICGEGFSAKDFRTWAGTLYAFKSLCQLPVPLSETEFKRASVEVVKSVSKVLGNTPTVCRKYYIHPILLEAFQNGELAQLYEGHNKKHNSGYEALEEKMLIAFLEKKAA